MKTLVSHSSLPSIIVLALLCVATSASAEEAFPATNGGVLVGLGDVTPRPQGIMLLRIDRVAHVMKFRMTVPALTEPITRSWLARDLADGREVMLELPISGPGPTFTGTVDGLTDAEIATIDSGKAAVVMASATVPTGYVVGMVEYVPSALAMSLERIPESSQGRGRFWMTVDRETSRAMLNVSWEGLTGRVIGVDIHNPIDSVLGPALHSMTVPTADSIILGTWDLSASDIMNLTQARLVVNVRTDSFPQGEIRGLIVPVEFYSAAIEPSNEVPPISSSLTGTAYSAVFLNPDQTATFAVNASVANVPATGLTLRRAPIGANGPEIYQFDSSTYRVGWWELQKSSLPQADLASLRLQNLYVNAHTTAHPDGEARGQLIASETNLSYTSGVPPPGRSGGSLLSVVERAGRLDISIDGATPGATLIVSNILGETIHTSSIQSNRMSVDLGGFPRSAFFLQLVADGRVVARWNGVAGGH